MPKTMSSRSSPTWLLLLASWLLAAPMPAIGVGFESESTQRSWNEALAVEREGFESLAAHTARAGERFLEAARRYEAIAQTEPEHPAPYWRASRCLWFAGELLPVEEREERLRHFGAALSLTTRCLDAEPDSAECMFWKFSAMGRVSTERGLLSGLRGAREMAQLLDRGIALEPTHREGSYNSTLGNLHYGSAIFYRVLPDWVWLGWLLGVRGDKDRALDHAEMALALHPERLDYRVEVASQLLCLGASENQQTRLDEGVLMFGGMLEDLRRVAARSARDERQMRAVAIMLETPAKSCGYTGADWVEIDAARAAAVGSGVGGEERE
jgi:tetratricopeptide (TPR) repeat protein